jgi:hypothetical protein
MILVPFLMKLVTSLLSSSLSSMNSLSFVYDGEVCSSIFKRRLLGILLSFFSCARLSFFFSISLVKDRQMSPKS